MKKPQLVTGRGDIFNHWIEAHSEEEKRDHVTYILNKYRVPQKLKVVMLASNMGLKIERLYKGHKEWLPTDDPQWYSYVDYTKFRVAGTKE